MLDRGKARNLQTHTEGSGSQTERETLNVRSIPVEQITPNDFCVRDDTEDDIDTLAQNIKENGLLEFPSVVASGDTGYVLLAGRRRYRATRKLGWTSMPCHIMDLSQEQAAWVAWHENAQRKDPSPVDQAKFIRRMKEQFGLTEIQIAEKMGVRQSAVSERHSILALPDEILDSIQTRPESPFHYYHAVELAKIMRTHHPARELLTRRLFTKTKEGKTPASQLRAIVQVIRDGTFDALPPSLRTLLVSNSHMTTATVTLFFKPEHVVDGDGEVAKRLRNIAESLTPEERERFIIRAARQEWSYERAALQMHKVLERKAKEAAKRDKHKNTSESGAKKLLDLMYRMANDMEDAQYLLSALENSSQRDVTRLRGVAETLHNRWRRIFSTIDAATRSDPTKSEESEQPSMEEGR